MLRKCQGKCSLCRRSKQGWQLDFHFLCLGLFMCFWFPIRQTLWLHLLEARGKQWRGSFSNRRGVFIGSRVSVNQAWEASGLEWGTRGWCVVPAGTRAQLELQEWCIYFSGVTLCDFMHTYRHTSHLACKDTSQCRPSYMVYRCIFLLQSEDDSNISPLLTPCLL